MRCDDIFERSGKINNSRCKKNFALISNKFKLRYKASSSSNSKTSTSKSPNRSAPSPSPSLPQTLKSKAQPRGAHGFGLVQGKLEREGRLSWILMHGSYFGWWFIYGCSIPKMELEHTYFISFPQIDPLSLFPDPFVDQLLRWVHSDIKFHLFGFCIFPHFAWKSPVSQCELITYWKSVWIRLHIQALSSLVEGSHCMGFRVYLTLFLVQNQA